MNRPARLAALLAAGALMLSACTSSSANGNAFTFHGAQKSGQLIPVAQRKPAEQFTGSLLSGGGTYTLSQDDGKVTVVNFWGAWCPPCRVETPNFEKVYTEYTAAKKAVAFVGIDFKEASRGLPRAFVALHHVTYPIVYDKDGATAVRLGNVPTQAAPFTIILDSEHRVAGVYIGALQPADLEPMLNTLLAEK